MKLRDHQVIKCDSVTITVKKDGAHYKSTYSVGLISLKNNTATRTTVPSRSLAKQEVIRLLRLYTNLTKSQILQMRELKYK